MLKRFFLLLIVAMLNVVALWALDVININTQYPVGKDCYEVHVGDTKFAEPAVTVRDGSSNNVTSSYSIEYSISGNAEGTYLGSDDISDRGIAIVKDDHASGDATGTTVEKYYGDVIMGKAGYVWVRVTATPKSGTDEEKAAGRLTSSYKIHIQAIDVNLTFTPTLTQPTASVTVNTKSDGTNMRKTELIVPTYTITTTTTGGIVTDITDRFDVDTTYVHTGSHPLSFNTGKTKLQRASEAAWTGTETGTLTYTFNPKSAYTGYYDSMTETVTVTFNALANDAAKKSLSLALNSSNFKQENVTEEDGTYTIHVYKFGQSDLGTNNNYQYKTPTPSLLSDGGALPIYTSGGGGAWGDFQLLYKIVEDSTYYDDCDFLYYNRSGSVQAAGEKTGLTIGDYQYQVAKPGLVKVAVYGVLSKDASYAADLKAMYESKKDGDGNDLIIKDEYKNEYIVYTEPQYFYIDVMKRKPSIVMTPDASSIDFLKYDVITMDDRIIISAIKGDDSNGIAGALEFGANDGWSDHFAYQFFISDRMDESLIHIDWYAYSASGDNKDSHPTWTANGGDQYSFIDWHATGSKKSESVSIQAGDIIKTNETVTVTATEDFNVYTAGEYPTRNLIGQTVTIGGTPVLITHANIAQLVGLKKGETITLDKYVLITSDNKKSYTGTHSYLDEGDYEKGITYNSMRGYGNEDWQITFKAKGNYIIPYTARPWNHTKWDNSDEKTITFHVVENPYPTAIRLSYYYKVIKAGESTTAPTDKVVVPAWNDHDVTVEGGFRYPEKSPYTYNGFSYSFSEGYTTSGYIQTHTESNCTLNTTTGEINTSAGVAGKSFTVYVNATKNSGYTKYADPSQVEYTIRIVDESTMAKWEIISTCKETEADRCSESTRFDFDDATDYARAMGRMHFYTTNSSLSDGASAGTVYGGTLIEGVPGITMTIGKAGVDDSSDADWRAIATNADGTLKCCAHEAKSVVVIPNAPVELDQESKAGIPTGGAFYQFNPTVNGYLTIDAKIYNTHTIVLITQRADGVIEDEVIQLSKLSAAELAALAPNDKVAKLVTEDGKQNLLGDYTFKKALIAGQTYYLYDVTNSMQLNLHGFSYTPAYILDRNTTISESQAPISAVTFMNGLVSTVPTLMSSVDAPVTFNVTDHYSKGVTASDYLGVDSKGQLVIKKMTVDGSGNVFKLRVTATVSSSNETKWGDCVAKTTYFDISIIDIPTYAVDDDMDEFANIAVGKTVTTENISTDITMTFGGWTEASGEDQKYHYDYSAGAKEDTWTFKSTGGPASRIGSELADNSTEYNKTIDGFEFFNASNNNPMDELNKSALQKVSATQAVGNDNSYTYGSGTDFETSTTTYYNTTYRLPCRGAYLKFEPRESGTLLVYLVQNGSCDYHEGIVNINKEYQIKWRPLYITDETGKPVTMENSFTGTQFLPTGNDDTHRGSFTLGISRCGKNPQAIRDAWDIDGAASENVESGCAFDWSEFKGTAADRAALLAAEAWPEKGGRESIIRLTNGGFVLPHKAYVRYAFHVKAGKTYFVFQPGSKFEFGGFSFLPVGYPSTCKYDITSHPAVTRKGQTAVEAYNLTNQEKLWNDASPTSGTDPDTDKTFTWAKNATIFNSANVENLHVTINDRRYSELAGANTFNHRTFTAGKWESLCLPFSVSESEMTRVFGEDYVLLTCDGVNANNQLHFVRHANRYVEAARPYLIKPSQNLTKLTFNHVTIEGTETVAKLSSGTTPLTNPERFNVDVNGEYTFKGTLYRTTLPKNSIFTNNGEGLYISTTETANARIGGYRAFFYKEDTPTPSSLSLAFTYEDLTPEGIENDTPTGVILVEGSTGNIREVRRNDAIYTVNGQKYSDNPLDLNNAPSGVYIVGGQTIVK